MEPQEEMTPQDKFKKGRRSKANDEKEAMAKAAAFGASLEAAPPTDEAAAAADAEAQDAASAEEGMPEADPVADAAAAEAAGADAATAELSPEEAHKEAAWAGRLRKREEELAAKEAMLAQREGDLGQREEAATINKAVQTKKDEGMMPSEKTVAREGEDTSGDPLARFAEDFGDDFVADLKVAIANEAKAAISEVMELVVDELSQRMEMVVGGINDAFNEMHFESIRGSHEDFDDIVGSDEFKQWPDMLTDEEKAEAANVIQNGTSRQVIKLIEKFKSRGENKQHQDQIDESALKAASSVRSVNASPNVGGGDSADPMSAFLRGRRSRGG